MDVRAQACSYLRAGRVTVTAAAATEHDGQRRADVVRAHVDGHSSTYLVHLVDNTWSCTCRRPAECAHVAAVQLVTGHPSLARKPGKR
ncbi:hypothetical protein [Nonomuraea sp. NPDC023979]|uniref:hypothetical protein n=1 Tax=Nonomuraea sp. NPDC023979 TaxID=3154796 RepID=UPI0033FE4724